MIDKFLPDLHERLDAVWDGASIAVGGFGSSGRPDALLNALSDLGKKDLHIYANNVGDDFTGVGRLVMEGRVRRITASFPVLPEFYEEYFAGRVELELVPQGTLAERLRAGGSGITAFYTPSGAGTMLADGTFPASYRHGAPEEYLLAKESRDFGGRAHVLEYGVRADFGLVKAHQADAKGNLRFRLSARNFNPLVAMSGRTTFAETEQLLDSGSIAPDDVHLPGVFVDHVVTTAAPVPADLPRSIPAP